MQTIKKTLPNLSVTIPPLFTFILIRYYVRYFLGIKLGYAFGTDYDFVPHFIIAFFILLKTTNRKQNTSFRLNKIAGVLGFFLILVFMVGTYYLKSWVTYQNPAFMVAWFALAFSIVGTSAFLFMTPGHLFKASNRILLSLAFLAGCSGWIAQFILQRVWGLISQLTGIAVFRVVKFFMPQAEYLLKPVIQTNGLSENFTLIKSKVFVIAIGRGCSGLDGISLFTFVFFLFLFVGYKKLNWKSWFTHYAIGISMMYFLNIFRLSLFFIISCTGISYFHNSAATKTGIALFHNSIGWILYAFGLVAWSWLLYRKEKKQQSSNSLNYLNSRRPLT